MKNTTMQRKSLAIFMALMLYGCSAIAVPVRGPINHAEAPVWIKEHFKCDSDYATLIKEFIDSIDTLIYNFLDHAGNQHNCVWYIAQFQARLGYLKQLVAKGKNCGNNANASKALTDVYKILNDICGRIQDSLGKPNNAPMLGAALSPLIDKFKEKVPFILTMDERLEAKYGSMNAITYIIHLRTRLQIQ